MVEFVVAGRTNVCSDVRAEFGRVRPVAYRSIATIYDEIFLLESGGQSGLLANVVVHLQSLLNVSHIRQHVRVAQFCQCGRHVTGQRTVLGRLLGCRRCFEPGQLFVQSIHWNGRSFIGSGNTKYIFSFTLFTLFQFQLVRCDNGNFGVHLLSLSGHTVEHIVFANVDLFSGNGMCATKFM